MGDQFVWHSVCLDPDTNRDVMNDALICGLPVSDYIFLCVQVCHYIGNGRMRTLADSEQLHRDVNFLVAGVGVA
jgi:hypothetical protein